MELSAPAGNDLTNQLAELARIPPENRAHFRCEIDWILKLPRTPAMKPKIPEQLEQIANTASRLNKKLGQYPMNVLIDSGLRATGEASYQHCIEALDGLGRAVQWCKENTHRPRGRPGGMQTRFDVLVWQQLSAARRYGGDLPVGWHAPPKSG
jgi:hypothetical protein